ncbi:MAG: hypothetical protein HYR56_14080 [Acidobacteria bacterium]|nr:hypothetical protein [Acidobacteriota bacterium]
MRMTNFVLSGVFAAALLVGTGLAQGQQKVEFYLDGKVGTEVVKKGTYTVTVPEGEQGTLEIKVGKKVIAATDNGDGTRSIASITPKGKKYTLVIGSGEVAAKPQTQPGKPGSEK